MKQLLGLFVLSLVTLTQCKKASERCETYECRRSNIEIYLENERPVIQEPTNLIVKRNEFYRPKMRVFIGEYDDDFKLPEGEPMEYYEVTDSSASISLIFETAGKKVVRGIVEEYKPIAKDVVESYHYRFELTTEVSEPASEKFTTSNPKKLNSDLTS